MKTLLIGALTCLTTTGVAMAAGSASLLTSDQYTITATALDGGGGVFGTGTPPGTNWYNGITGDYAAFGPAAGPVGFDDYATSASDAILMTEFQFVGGVDTVGGVVFFNFYDDDLNFVDGFGIALSQAGNFIWTITFNDDVIIDSSGALEMVVDDGTAGGPAGVLGQFFLTPNAPTVGSNDILFGGNPGAHYHAFAITGEIVPAPGVLALLGIAGLAGTSRRRRA